MVTVSSRIAFFSSCIVNWRLLCTFSFKYGEICDCQVRRNCRLCDVSETRNYPTEEIAKHFHNASSSFYWMSILLEVEIIGKYTKCFQLRKQEVLQYRYVTLSSDCQSFSFIIFKQNGPTILHCTPFTTLDELNGSSCSSLGFHGAQYSIFFLTKPDMWLWASSLITTPFKTPGYF